MSNSSANNTPQTSRISLQQIGIAGALLAGIFLYFIYPMAIIFIGIAAVGGAIAWHFAEKKAAYREAQARADAFANICGPVLISSSHPFETVEEVRERADEFKRQLELSRNRYWQAIPVIVYPYQPMLYGPGQLTAAWNIYQRMASEYLHAENIKWAESGPAELRQIFLSQVMPQPKEETI